MMKEIRRWFFLKTVELTRKKLFKQQKIPFDRDFAKRVRSLGKMLGWQLGGKVKVSFDHDKARLSHKGRVIVEVAARHSWEHTHIFVETTLNSIPLWWIRLAFSNMKWTASRNVESRQLTYDKPREN
jgi:hypothetical protein